ncbi:MAG TPA: hypothetical protein VFB54_12025 [Burkholderiales bacterium]|nr:hypothetical protein [Burkholderiales bacterium]
MSTDECLKPPSGFAHGLRTRKVRVEIDVPIDLMPDEHGHPSLFIIQQCLGVACKALVEHIAGEHTEWYMENCGD